MISTNPEAPRLKMPRLPPSVEHNGIKQVCEKFYPYMMDFYNREGKSFSVKQFNFSVNEILYEYGPELIMCVSAEHQGLEKKDLLFRWIHLPANNVCQHQGLS